MFQLRPYQQEASDAAVDFFNSKSEVNAIEVLPTGSGKSLVIADIAITKRGNITHDNAPNLFFVFNGMNFQKSMQQKITSIKENTIVALEITENIIFSFDNP